MQFINVEGRKKSSQLMKEGHLPYKSIFPCLSAKKSIGM